MSLQQKVRSISRGPSTVVRTMVRSVAQRFGNTSKKERALAKSPDAFPWDEVSEVSTCDGDAICSWTSGDSLASAPLCAQPCDRDEPVVIFDWDDTLLPTTFVDFLGQLPANGRQFEAAEKHAKQVESILRTARSLGRVAIVTMANKKWLVKSAERYLPGLDVEALTEELDIPVVYASEYGSSGAASSHRPRAVLVSQQWQCCMAQQIRAGRAGLSRREELGRPRELGRRG